MNDISASMNVSLQWVYGFDLSKDAFVFEIPPQRSDIYKVQEKNIAAGELISIHQSESALGDAQLWSPETPMVTCIDQVVKDNLVFEVEQLIGAERQMIFKPFFLFMLRQLVFFMIKAWLNTNLLPMIYKKHSRYMGIVLK